MEEKDKDKKLITIIIVTAIVIIGSWLTTYYILRGLEHRGSFGDMFGSINALFSGLALAGIIITIYMQRIELGYQRDELKATREEFKIQNKTLKAQRFENTFFNLVSLHHQIIDGIDLDKEVVKGDNNFFRSSDGNDIQIVTVKGRDVFKDKYEELQYYFYGKFNESKKEFPKDYLKFYSKVQTDFGHYFRNLYRILKFIDETEFFTKAELGISPEETRYETVIDYQISNFRERYKYTSMIRAQLSDYELLWLFYNSLSTNGIEKFKPLIEEYSLFKNIPKDKIKDEKLINQYKTSAFEKK